MFYINKYIHQIWFQGIHLIPSKYEKLRGSWISCHPDWYYRLWDQNSLYQLLINFYPDLVPVVKKLKYDIQKIHFFKYLLLFHYGGIVVNVDIYCNQNIEPLLQDVHVVLVNRFDKKGKNNNKIKTISHGKFKDGPFFTTAFMASNERNIFWLQVLKEMLIQSYHPKYYELFEQYIYRSSGSTLLTSVYFEKPRQKFKILDKKFINPTGWLCSAKILTMMNIKPNLKKRKEAFLIDHHDHTWSKAKNIVPIIIFVVFIVLAAIIIKTYFYRKTKPQSKLDKETSKFTSVLS